MEAPTRFKCIVCIGLLNNPVILPCCGNYLCKACIQGLTQSGTSRCPYPQCSRERLQNKIRTAEKKGKLYATELWDEIQQRFPNFDYEGNDDVEDMIGRLSRPFLILCQAYPRSRRRVLDLKGLILWQCANRSFLSPFRIQCR